MKTDRIVQIMPSLYLNLFFFIGLCAERIIYGYGYRFFRWPELVRIWSGTGSKTDFNSRVTCAYIENYMLVKN